MTGHAACDIICHDFFFSAIGIRDNGVCDGENSFGDEENLHVDVDLIRKRVEQMCGGTMQVESGEEDETVVTIRIPDEMSRLRAGSL